MKLVLLTDGSEQNFETLMTALSDRESRFIDTENCDEIQEYRNIAFQIRNFASLDKEEILLVKFSGRETVFRELGDEFSEMIIYLSYNKNSKYYTECPIGTFLSIINIFEKGETINAITTK